MGSQKNQRTRIWNEALVSFDLSMNTLLWILRACSAALPSSSHPQLDRGRPWRVDCGWNEQPPSTLCQRGAQRPRCRPGRCTAALPRADRVALRGRQSESTYRSLQSRRKIPHEK